MTNYAIETYALSRRYGKHVAVDQLELAVRPGTIFGFIGPNGAGKTTTMRMLAGLLEPTSGTIQLLGQPLTTTSASRDLVGYMPDFFGVYNDLRVWEYLDFYARCHDIPAAQRRTTIDSLLQLVDLHHKRNAFVQHLSRGMQQRLCLAHALVHDPPILLLDEPASGLDPQARIELLELLRELCAMDKTILLSSHILSELEDVCTEIGIMINGQLRASGPIETLRQGGQQQLQVVVLEGAEAAAQLLGQHPAIHSVQPPEHNTVRALFHGDDATAADILQALLNAGIVVVDFHRAADSLERMFLRLIHGAPAEEVLV